MSNIVPTRRGTSGASGRLSSYPEEFGCLDAFHRAEGFPNPSIFERSLSIKYTRVFVLSDL